MDDLIRRGALLEQIPKTGALKAAYIRGLINATPSVDAVEVAHARWTRKDNSQNCKRIGDFE